MRIEQCVALAITNDLDIMQVMPVLADCKVEEVEPLVSGFVTELSDTLVERVMEFRPLLDAKDEKGLACVLMGKNLGLPLPMLSAMCETIVKTYAMQAMYRGNMRTGEAVYDVKMTIDVSDLADRGRLLA